LAISGCIDLSGQVEGGGLEFGWTIIHVEVEFFVAKVLIPFKFCFGFFGVSGGVNEKHIGLGLVLVVNISFGTLICLIVDEWQGAPMIGIAIIWCWRRWRLIESRGNEVVLGVEGV
jgi:hypothetical protein